MVNWSGLVDWWNWWNWWIDVLVNYWDLLGVASMARVRTRQGQSTGPGQSTIGSLGTVGR